MGVPAEAAGGLLTRVAKTSGILLEGVFTHLARADEPDPAPSRFQVEKLAEILDRFRSGEDETRTPKCDVHIANSAALLRLEEIETPSIGLLTEAVRPGLMLYGVSPFADRSAESLDLEPVMTLAARVVALRRIEAGDSVGYGAEWRASKATTIATLPIGYADGMPRALLGRGEVHLAGEMRPIVGRISMDSVCVDVGEARVELGEIATIFGRTPEGKRIPVEGLAAAAGTVGYEILVGVGARVPRRVGVGGLPGKT
jgi:alanine racemase